NQSFQLLFKSAEKLSTGLKINSAADDPAGLVISERMRARIASLNQEIENVSMQIRKYETASSHALQLRSMLTEMHSLAVAASSEGFNSEAMQNAYQAEANRLVESYNFIAQNAAFGEQMLLDGSGGSLANIQVMEQLDLSSAESAQAAMQVIDNEAARLDSVVADIGASQKNDLESRLTNLRVEAENLTAAESQIRDTDFTLEFTNFIKYQMMARVSVSLLAHSFLTPQSVLALVAEK
ncbi:MAG: flagellin, partial [Candidatus Zixiibacteriota bacterium]